MKDVKMYKLLAEQVDLKKDSVTMLAIKDSILILEVIVYDDDDIRYCISDDDNNKEYKFLDLETLVDYLVDYYNNHAITL